MHTFNLGLVFGNAELVYIISCSSEHPIDERKVNFVATDYFKRAITCCEDTHEVLAQMADGISKECNCKASVIVSNAAIMIPRK